MQNATSSPNPWVTMWTQPRSTIQAIVDADPRRNVLLLAALGGIVQALGRAADRSVGYVMSLPAILGTSVVAGSLAGILSLYVIGALVGWTGSRIGGRASYPQVRCAIAWSQVPYLWISLLWGPKLLLFREEIFTAEMPRIEASPVLLALYLVFFAAQITGAIWALVACLKCLGQVQGFSAWKALGNCVIAALIVVLPVALIVTVVAMLTNL